MFKVAKKYYKMNLRILHREDGPAVILIDGSTIWYFNNKIHRDNGPAIELANGYKEWRVHGITHRLDGPAIIDSRGNEKYYIYGKRFKKTDFLNLNRVKKALK